MADGLTDEELRRQLVQLGAKTVGPITATTRAIYIKKLNHLKFAAKKANVLPAKEKHSRKLLGFSSDESEGESASEPVSRRRGSSALGRANSKQDTGSTQAYLGRRPLRNTRNDYGHNDKHMSSFSMQTSLNSTGDAETSGRPDRGSSRRSSAGIYRLPAAASTTTTTRSDPNGFDSSDSDADRDSDDTNDLDDTDLSYTSSREKVSVSVNTSPHLDDSSFFNRTFSKLPGVSMLRGRKSSEGRQPAVSGETTISSSQLSRPKSPVTVTDGKTPNHRPSSSRYGLPGGLGISAGGQGPRRSARINTTDSQQSTNPQTSSSNPNRQVQNQNFQPRSPPLNHSAANHITPDGDKLSDEENILQQGFKTKEDPSAYKISQNISKVLLFLAALFFVALAGFYISMNTPASGVTPVPVEDSWMICRSDTGTTEGAHPVPCYPLHKVVSAREVVLEVAEMLSIRAGDYECARSVTKNMTEQEVRQRLVNKWGNDFGTEKDKKYNFKVALHLIQKNPHWKIRLYDASGNDVENHHQVSWLQSEAPYFGFLCNVKRLAIRLCYYVAGLMSVLLLVGAVWFCWRRREEETRQVYSLVERILDTLKKHHDSCQANPHLQPFLAIPHVRDMLIPPEDRRRLQRRWDMAVKFLSANESRIRVEMQKIFGEEFAVWRWSQPPTDSKVWQGPACPENPNLPNFKSPTQCLKIRSMFDPEIECEENWHVHIEDAILEKVTHANGSHGIVHVAVDKTSREGCVYIKCVSPQEAGKAFRALHGWWFDGNLVTVKYIRLERYHERFPEAAMPLKMAMKPLTPSNNQRRSLSQPFHRSIIESC